MNKRYELVVGRKQAAIIDTYFPRNGKPTFLMPNPAMADYAFCPTNETVDRLRRKTIAMNESNTVPRDEAETLVNKVGRLEQLLIQVFPQIKAMKIEGRL